MQAQLPCATSHHTRAAAAHPRVHRRAASVQPRLTPVCASTQAEQQQTTAAQLRNWVVQHSPKGLPTPLYPQPRASGYGMVTEAEVQPGQSLVRVPRELMMTEDSALRQKEYSQLIKKGDLTEWQTLILHLLCERAKGPASHWAPYINMLPKQDHHPLMWTEQDTAALQGSPLLGSLQTRWQQVVEDTDVLLACGANELPLAQEYQNCHKEHLVSQSSVSWAAATLLSRAFSLDLTTDDEMVAGDLSHYGTWMEHVPDALALVPWADMLCHSSAAGPDSCLRFDCQSQSAALSAHKAYATGEEVFDSYGCNLSPTDLLLDYGFVDPLNTNHRTLIDPYSIARPTSGRAKVLLEAMEALHGPGEDMRFVLSQKGPDFSALTWVRAALASDADLIRAGWKVKATSKDVTLACKVMGSLAPIDEKREAEVLKAVKAAVLRAESAYPTSLEQDQQELQQQDLPWRRQQMLLGLASEKQALRGCLATVAFWLAELEEGCSVDELYEGIEDWEGNASEEQLWEMSGLSNMSSIEDEGDLGVLPNTAGRRQSREQVGKGTS